MSSTYEDLVVVPTIDSEPTEAELTEPTEPTEPAEPAEAELAGLTEGDLAEPEPAQDTSAAAARLLEIAARNADQLLNEAQAEADAMKASARDEADQLLSEARTEAERVRTELEQSRTRANDEIAKLWETEQAHRDRMREHLHEVLAKVEATSVA